MSLPALAEDTQPLDPVLMPPLYRSEGFAEDLLDSPEATDPLPSRPAASQRPAHAPVRSAPWTLALLGIALSALT